MHELLCYSIFAIVLYFVLSQVFDNFYLEQENFDPSLVPVSSIVTLAKVAQKLVNGNGTLTNPGNLQIGKDASAPGNLTVTGMATIGGPIVGNGNYTGLTVNGNLNAKGYGLNVDNMISLGASNVQLGSDGAHGLKVMNENGALSNITAVNINTSGNTFIDGRGIQTNAAEMLIKTRDGANVRIWDSPLSVDKQFKAGNITINNGGNSPNLLYNNATNDNFLIKAQNQIVQIWSSNLNVDKNLTVGENIEVASGKYIRIRDSAHQIQYINSDDKIDFQTGNGLRIYGNTDIINNGQGGGHLNVAGSITISGAGGTTDVGVYGTGGGQTNKAYIKTPAVSIGKLNGVSSMISAEGNLIIQAGGGTTEFLVNAVKINNDLTVGGSLIVGGVTITGAALNACTS